MVGHSKTNGNQAKALMRELRAQRSEMRDLKSQIDSIVALADHELGVSYRGPEFPVRSQGGVQTYPGGRGYTSGSGTTRAAPIQSVPQPRPDPQAPAASRMTTSTFGVSGTPITAGFLLDLGEYNPELQGRNAIPTYEQMRRGDAQVRATVAACKLPVQSAKWEIVPSETRAIGSSGDPRNTIDDSMDRSFSHPISSTGTGKTTANKAKEVAAFVRENLFGGLEFQTTTGAWTSQPWDEVVRNALLMLDFGCAVHEDVWTVDGSRIRLRKLAARLPLTFYRWHTEGDGETLLALEQYGYRGSRFLNVTLPADKIAVFTHNQEGANFWGIALLRAMYPHWYIKSQLYRIDAIACERNALGIPVFKLAPGFSKEDRDAAYNFVTQVATHEATGMVEPPGDASTGFRIVGYEGRVRDVMPSIQHHNVMISRAALALFMDLGQAEHGSRALGKAHGDFFMLALQSLADQIALKLTTTSIRRLVALNFGDHAPCPSLVAANVQARGLEDIVEALTQFAQAGLVVSEENLRRFIRQELALPEESSRNVVAIRGEVVDEGTGGATGRSGGGVEERPPEKGFDYVSLPRN